MDDDYSEAVSGWGVPGDHHLSESAGPVTIQPSLPKVIKSN